MSSKSFSNRAASGKSFEQPIIRKKQRHSKKVELKEEFRYLENYTDFSIYNWKIRIGKGKLKIDAWMPVYENGKKVYKTKSNREPVEVHVRHTYIPDWYYYNPSENRIYVGLSENNPRKHSIYTGDNKFRRKLMISEQNRVFNERYNMEIQPWSEIVTMIKEYLTCASVIDYLDDS